MNRRPFANTLLLMLAICSIALLAGCNYLTVFVTIDQNGAGTRSLQAKIDSELGETSSPTYAQAIELLGITPKNGWKPKTDTGSGAGDKQSRPMFERVTPMKNAQSWKNASGDLSILGTLESTATDQLLFANAVDFSMERSTGRRTFTYRESFSWISFLTYYTDCESDRLWHALRDRYPVLQRDDEIEIRGLIAGLIAMTTDLQTGDDTCDEADDALDRTLANTLFQIIRRRSPSVSKEELSRFLDQTLDDSNDQFEVHLQKDMPGAYLATKTEIVLNITFPGRIVESNAHRIEGQTASWTIHPLDAIARPVELLLISEFLE